MEKKFVLNETAMVYRHLRVCI